MKKKILFILIVVYTTINFAQTNIYQESFEAVASASTYTVQPSFFNDGGSDYFVRTTPAAITGSLGTTSTITGQDGSNIVVTEDLDGSGGPCDQETCLLTSSPGIPNPPARTGVEIGQITTASININSISLTTLKINVAAPGSGYEVYNEMTGRPDYVQITYSVDGGAYLQLGLFTGNGSGGFSQDTNNDDIGDGSIIGAALTEFSFDISGISGNTLQIKINISSNAGSEEIGIDNLRVRGTAAAALPTVTTTAASAVANTSATLAGNVTADGGATVTERGIVYSTSDATPTIAEGATKDTNGTGTGVFTEAITGLAAGTQYYFNAYAINSEGTSYGTAATFTTTGKGWLGTTTDWATATNWSPSGIPTATDDVVIPNIANKPIIGSSTNALANDITIDASSSITVTGGGSLTLDGDLTNNGTLTLSSGMSASSSASLMVSGSSTGNITYQRYVSANWHLISSPVEGQQIGSFITASGLTDGTVNTDHTGLGFYNNATPVWEYFLNSALPTSNFIPGNGYAALKTAAGTVDFTGTLKTNDLTGYAITEGDDGWNLIGNPYPSYIDVNAFLTTNLTSFDASFANVYVWNGTAYAPISGATYMAPGQGFFVKSKTGGATINITEAMQSHQSATFYRNNSNPEINLSITDQANNTRNTKINFLDGKTTGLDPMFDVGMFTATNNSYAVYSHLISDSQGIDFEIQALPNQDYETVIVPIGINAVAGKEITFKVEDLNLPAGIKVFLEDRENNTFIRLDEDNSQHTVNVTNPLSGIGRFYLRTSSNSLSVDDLNLENINIYTMDNSILRIAGIEATGKKTLSMFDILGQRIVQESFNTNGVKDITLPNVSSGVYIIHLQTERGRLSKKIILN